MGNISHSCGPQNYKEIQRRQKEKSRPPKERMSNNVDRMVLLDYIENLKQTMRDQEYLDIMNELKYHRIHPLLKERLDKCGRRMRRRLTRIIEVEGDSEKRLDRRTGPINLPHYC